VVFGDSLSDVGNIREVTELFGLDPVLPDPAAGYYDGRFTNGPVWVDLLADRLSLPRSTPSLLGGKNHAFGGARVLQPTLLAPELSDIVADVTSVSPSDWVIVSGGPNDIWNAKLETREAFTQLGLDVSRGKAAAMETLIGRGATQLLVAGIPNLLAAPAVRGSAPNLLEGFEAAIDASNGEMARLVEQARRDHPGVRLEFLDIRGLQSMWLADPARYGFTNVTDPAAVLSTNPLLAASGLAGAPPLIPADQVNGYLFYDAVHPGNHSHALLAAAAADLMQVPEPTVGASVIFWMACLCAMRRRSSPRASSDRTDNRVSYSS